jgi:cell division protein FtsI (penicillin-binding protein 3)
MDTTKKWVELPATYLPSDLDRFAGIDGVHRTRELTRIISAPKGIVGFLGTVRDETTPVGGIEAELDSLLRGESGRDARVKDGRGNLLETPALSGFAARPGHTVSLTINQQLQEIAERGLADGIQRTGASGGDVVMMDPRDGSVLAMAGVRNRKPSVTATALAEPYEAGSVMKVFVISRALDLKRVHADEMINTEGGKWLVAKRTITDEHKAAYMSVRDVVRQSSNIGAGKIGTRLSQREEYEALRDFGFGTPTGVPYPAESRGVLPTRWNAQTPTAVAMGYEVSATPLQIAAAYVAIANGGELLQPSVVREVRDPDGQVVFTHERRVVRRVLSKETAALMREMLASVVDSGTAAAADMATYDVGGKSGTARRAEGKRGYVPGKYNSSFAGMFPIQAPQFVLVVRLIDPEGKIYGGTVSGTVVKEILRASLATRDASLDRRALASIAKPIPTRPAKAHTLHEIAVAMEDSARFDSLRAPVPQPVAPLAAPQRVVVSLPLAPARAKKGGDAAPSGELRAVPSVYGLDARQATLTLHAAGFHVSVSAGQATRTRPAAGTLARSGSVVVLETPR